MFTSCVFFLFVLFSVYPKCGGDIYKSSGWLSSIDRDGDGLYDPTLDCVWILHAPEDKVIQIQFLYVKIHYTQDCHFDSLKVKP